MAPDTNVRTQKNTVEARQGTTRPKLIYVLIAGIVLIVLAFVAIGLLQPR